MITENGRDYTERAQADTLRKCCMLALAGKEEEEERGMRGESMHFKVERKASSMRVSPPSTVGVPVTAIALGDSEGTYGGQGSR